MYTITVKNLGPDVGPYTKVEASVNFGGRSWKAITNRVVFDEDFRPTQRAEDLVLNQMWRYLGAN